MLSGTTKIVLFCLYDMLRYLKISWEKYWNFIPSWRRLGAVLGRLGAVLGRLRPSWGRLKAFIFFSVVFFLVFVCFFFCFVLVLLSLCSAVLGPSWGCFGASWGRLGASWRPTPKDSQGAPFFGGLLGPSWPHFWEVFGWFLGWIFNTFLILSFIS